MYQVAQRMGTFEGKGVQMRIIGPGEYRAEHQEDALVASELLRAAMGFRERADKRGSLAEELASEAIYARRLLADYDADTLALMQDLLLNTVDSIVVNAGRLLESISGDAHTAAVEEERWQEVVKKGPRPRRQPRFGNFSKKFAREPSKINEYRRFRR